MATLLAPYNQAMQLGTGFNSFTQQLCIDRAVVSPQQLAGLTGKDHASTKAIGPKREEPKTQEEVEIAQDVSYKASVVDKVTDVTSEMNINAAFAIKYDAFDAKGKIDFVNTSKVKESDVSFLFSVKVVNQVIYDHSLTEIVPIGIGKDGRSNLDGKAFADIYGDSFISGFQEGGTFTAVISVKAKSEEKKRDIQAKADIFFTKPKTEEAKGLYGDGKNKVGFHLGFDNFNDSFLQENETTISVSYVGGGQRLKRPDQDWTFETMKAAALAFPALVAKTPMRTHAILTKYTSLRSYHQLYAGLSVPAFEVAGVYSMLLQEAYLDYKTVAKNLQVLAFDVSAGRVRLLTASEYRGLMEQLKRDKALEAARRKRAVEAADRDFSSSSPSGDASSSSSSSTSADTKADSGADTPGSEDSKTAASTITATTSSDKAPAAPAADPPKNETPSTNDTTKKPNALTWKPVRLTKEYAATLQGLEEARSMVRSFLVRIVQEINILSRHPELALDDERVQPHISPFLFKELLPIGQPITPDDEQEQELAKVTDKIDEMKAKKNQGI